MAAELLTAMDDSLWNLQQWQEVWQDLPLGSPLEEAQQLIVLLGINKSCNFYRRIYLPSSTSIP
jgi:hypothetical protein